MRTVEIVVEGDSETARVAANRALESRKFRLSWEDQWTAIAERGNKTVNALAGAFAQYFKVGLKLMSGNPGEVVLRFEQQSTGAMGGVIGMRRSTKNMGSLKDELATAFQEQGVLVSVNETK